VDEKAHSTGLQREAYIRAVLSKDVTGAPSISDLLASFRDQVAASGVTAEELDRLFAEAREESYRERTLQPIDKL
jgi:hypothetical protein